MHCGECGGAGYLDFAKKFKCHLCNNESKMKEVESVEGPLDSGSTTTRNNCHVCGGIGHFYNNGIGFECMCKYTKSDSPTKPSHYHEGGIDVFAYMKANFTKEEQRGFHKGTAIKYISRAGKKKGNSYEQDMAKAKVHIEELERLGEEG